MSAAGWPAPLPPGLHAPPSGVTPRVARLDSVYPDDVRVIGTTDREPALIDDGAATTPASLAAAHRAETARMARVGQRNESQAVVAAPVAHADGRYLVRFRTLDYALRSLAREAFAAPLSAVSGTVVPVCPELRCLYVQRRAASLDTHPGKLHTFSGAFLPAQPDPAKPHDSLSVAQTARREFAEETGVVLDAVRAPAILVDHELRVGALEFVWLGVRLDPGQAAAMAESDEGAIAALPFGALADWLVGAHGGWVPAGRIHILAWLALGAPIPRAAPPLFAGESAAALFDRLVERL